MTQTATLGRDAERARLGITDATHPIPSEYGDPDGQFFHLGQKDTTELLVTYLQFRHTDHRPHTDTIRQAMEAIVTELSLRGQRP